MPDLVVLGCCDGTMTGIMEIVDGSSTVAVREMLTRSIQSLNVNRYVLTEY
jgi:hypothetical protein